MAMVTARRTASVPLSSASVADERDESARAVRLFLVLAALLVVAQGALNVTLNPAGRFGDRGILLRSIRTSDAYLKIQAFDAFLANHRGEPIGVVLGSSRVMML